MSINGDAYTANNDPLPERRGVNRLVGLSSEGRPVDNVVEANRYTVYEKDPWILVLLYDEDRQHVIDRVYMPNTRERPDTLVYEGQIYEVMTTNTVPPQYRLTMSLNAVKHPPQQGDRA